MKARAILAAAALAAVTACGSVKPYQPPTPTHDVLCDLPDCGAYGEDIARQGESMARLAASHVIDGRIFEAIVTKRRADGGLALCGQLTGKNAFGGYGKPIPFYVDGGIFRAVTSDSFYEQKQAYAEEYEKICRREYRLYD